MDTPSIAETSRAVRCFPLTFALLLQVTKVLDCAFVIIYDVLYAFIKSSHLAKKEKVLQAMAPKLSSKQKALLERLDAARAGTFEALGISLGAGLRDLDTVIETQMFRERVRLLVELANMRGDGTSRFRKTIGSARAETDTLLLKARGDLRQVWLRSTPVKEKQGIVNAWLASAAHIPGKIGVTASLRLGRIAFDPGNFRMQFVMAILENWRRLAVCANPECPAAYFLSKRRDQKYCERGECTKHGLREAAKKWWRAHGPAWRAKRRRARKQLQRRTKR